MHKQQPPSPLVLKYFLVLFLSTILLLFRLLWPFLSILILSFLLAGIFQPVYSFLKKYMSPYFASFMTCLAIIVVVFLPLSFFIGSLSQEAYALYLLGKTANIGLKLKAFTQESAFIVRLQDTLHSFGFELEADKASQYVSNIAKVAGLALYNQASSWAANLMNFIMNFFIMSITIFFLLVDHDRLINFILRLSPLPDEQERQLFLKFEEIAGAVLLGNGICGLIQGFIGGAIFAIFDLGPPILWGGVMGILAFLPIFGIGLVLVPTALILLLKGNIIGSLGLLVLYLILSLSIEYILKPKLVGDQVKMHTLLVFLAIMGGLSVFGFLGIIYGPLIVTAFLTLTEIYLLNYDEIIRFPPRSTDREGPAE